MPNILSDQTLPDFLTKEGITTPYEVYHNYSESLILKKLWNKELKY